MNKITTLLVCGAALMLFCPMADGEDSPKDSLDFSAVVTPLSAGETSEAQGAVPDELKRQASLYAAAVTLESEASFKDLDADSGYLPGKLHLMLSREKFDYDFEPMHRAKESSGATRGAFDGVTYQELSKESGHLRLSKLYPNSTLTFQTCDLILKPYDYFTHEERSADDAGHVLTLADLADPARWKDFTTHMILAGTATVLGMKTVAVELPYFAEVYTGRPGRIRYYLDPENDYYPMGWDAVDDRGRVISAYRITELGWADVKKGLRLPYPKKAIEQFFFNHDPDGTINFLPRAETTHEIVVSSFKVNIPLPEYAFTIDRTSAKSVRDLTDR